MSGICKTLLENPQIKQAIDQLLAYPAIEMQFFVCKKDKTLYPTLPEMGSPETVSYWTVCDNPLVSIHSHTEGDQLSVQDIVVAVEENCEHVCVIDVQNRKLTCVHTTSPKIYEIVDEYTETFSSTAQPVFYGTLKQALRAYNRLQDKVQKLPIECTAII